MLLSLPLASYLNQPRQLSMQYVQYAQSQCKCILAQVNSLEYVIKMEMLLKQIQYCERDEPIKMHGLGIVCVLQPDLFEEN